MAQQNPSAAVFPPGGTHLSSATSPRPRQIWAPHPRESLAAARAPPVLRTRAQWRARPCCSSPSSPSRSPSPSLAMGSAASTDRAERRRRDRAPGHSGAPDSLVARPQDPSASASEADVSGKGCKVAPEPKDEEETTPLPGSPSFRIYCQKAAQVDALVAETADENADGDHSDGFASAAGNLFPSPFSCHCSMLTSHHISFIQVHSADTLNPCRYDSGGQEE